MLYLDSSKLLKNRIKASCDCLMPTNYKTFYSFVKAALALSSKITFKRQECTIVLIIGRFSAK